MIGPDGFPDLTYGQSVIHPEQTGKWLKHVLTKAWAAQSDPSYSAAEKSQILAFGYGYLTHAAGDMWAHTLINDVSGGVFPSVGEILTDVDDAEIAIRHIIIEGYVGDATPGFDGNDERGPVPGEVNEDGNPEVSDDSTPHIPFAAPKRFIYETFIDPANPLPVGTSRGPLIDFFLDMQAELQVSEARYAWDSEFEDCLIIDPGLLRADQDADTSRPCAARRSTHIQYNNCEADVLLRARPGRSGRRPHDRQPRRDLPRALDRRHRGRPEELERPRARQHQGALRPAQHPAWRRTTSAATSPTTRTRCCAATARTASARSTCSATSPRTSSTTT